MKNLLEGLSKGEEKITHKELFDRGHEMADCILRNLTSEQIF